MISITRWLTIVYEILRSMKMAVQAEQIKTSSPLQRLDLIIKSSAENFKPIIRDGIRAGAWGLGQSVPATSATAMHDEVAFFGQRPELLFQRISAYAR